MNGIALDAPLHSWFDFRVPKTSIAPGYIVSQITEVGLAAARPTAKMVFIGSLPRVEIISKSKKRRDVGSGFYHLRDAAAFILHKSAAGARRMVDTAFIETRAGRGFHGRTSSRRL